MANWRNQIDICSFTGIYWSKASNRHKCQCIERLKQNLCEHWLLHFMKNTMWNMVNNLIAIQSLTICYFHIIDSGYKYVKNQASMPLCPLLNFKKITVLIFPVISSRCRKPEAVWFWKSNCGSLRCITVNAGAAPSRTGPHCFFLPPCHPEIRQHTEIPTPSSKRFLVWKWCLKTAVIKITNAGDVQKSCYPGVQLKPCLGFINHL